MKLSAPKKVVWLIAVILGVLGVIGKFVPIAIISGIAFWLVVAGCALLALATFIKGL